MAFQIELSARPARAVARRAAARAPVRDALRRSTQAAHERMHHLEPFQAIFEGRLALDRYLPLIGSLLVFHSSIGAAAAHSGLTSLSSASVRVDFLEDDIRSMGGTAISGTVDWQPRSPEEALGALYAAEGSMLGGRVIATQLNYLFGSSQNGRRFFIGSPGDIANWNKLLSALEEQCATAGALDEARDGALFGFQLFEECVTTYGSEGADCNVRSGARLL